MPSKRSFRADAKAAAGNFASRSTANAFSAATAAVTAALRSRSRASEQKVLVDTAFGIITYSKIMDGNVVSSSNERMVGPRTIIDYLMRVFAIASVAPGLNGKCSNIWRKK